MPGNSSSEFQLLLLLRVSLLMNSISPLIQRCRVFTKSRNGVNRSPPSWTTHKTLRPHEASRGQLSEEARTLRMRLDASHATAALTAFGFLDTTLMARGSVLFSPQAKQPSVNNALQLFALVGWLRECRNLKAQTRLQTCCCVRLSARVSPTCCVRSGYELGIICPSQVERKQAAKTALCTSCVSSTTVEAPKKATRTTRFLLLGRTPRSAAR